MFLIEYVFFSQQVVSELWFGRIFSQYALWLKLSLIFHIRKD